MIILIVTLLNSLAVQGIKKYQKIDSCRCSTDEGEIVEVICGVLQVEPQTCQGSYGTSTLLP